jgi:hypothetical protein
VANTFRLQPTIYAPSLESTLRSQPADGGELRGRESRDGINQGCQRTGERIHLSQTSNCSPEPVGAGS